MNFLTLDYLKDGSEIQNKIHFVLEKHQIFDKLKEYNPILTGTFPININIKNSDLDIILETDDLMRAKDFIINEFQNQKEFDIQFCKINDIDSLVCNFILEEFPIELFAQKVPTKLQNAYLHMIKEYEILEKEGEEFRKQIINLKEKGWKTEPAFAKLLGLKEDPYLELLNYSA
ncbi:MAG: DUF4269 domain-containing protein [Chryseobacterium sp.]|nr:DUF4269 domain-containing protein [Chryseobacterium sp.]